MKARIEYDILCFFYRMKKTKKMAVNTYSTVEFTSNGLPIISNETRIIRVGDGSLHRVPVINCAALKVIQSYHSSEEYDYDSSPGISLDENNGTRNEASSSPGTSFNENNGTRKEATDQDANSSLEVPTEKEDLFFFLLKNKIIPNNVRCKNCKSISSVRQKNSIADGYIWQCSSCKTNVSIRKGTVFEKSRLPLKTIFEIMRVWAAGIPGHQASTLVPSASKTAIYHWFKVCRSIITRRINKDKVYFTGKDVEINKIVQIDESSFGKSNKYHRGKKFKNYWMFGISQPSEHKCLLIPVEKRDEKTLMKIILEHVDLNCEMRIVSDGWAAYRNLREAGYTHSVVIHKEEFVNKEGYHTNSIESIWSQFKNWINSMHGLRNSTQIEYINEFMYRYNICGGTRNNALEPFLSDLRNYQNL